MKSKFFTSRSVGLSENHLKSLEIISKLPTDVLDEIAQWINTDLEIESRRLDSYYSYKNRVEKINDLCATCNISDGDFFAVVNFTLYFVRRVYELGDSLADVADDLVSKRLITKENRGKLLDFLQATEEKCKEVAKQYRKDNYGVRSLPVLNSMDYSVNLRLIPKTPFEVFETPIEEYRPKADELILSAIIEIITADGANKNAFSFQLNFLELEELIVRLQACQKEMRLLQSYYEKYDITNM